MIAKKITLYFAICDSRFVQIFGFVILGRGGSGPREKNPFNKRAGSGPRVLARGSGPGMEKPGSNPTRCHS